MSYDAGNPFGCSFHRRECMLVGHRPESARKPALEEQPLTAPEAQPVGKPHADALHSPRRREKREKCLAEGAAATREQISLEVLDSDEGRANASRQSLILGPELHRRASSMPPQRQPISGVAVTRQAAPAVASADRDWAFHSVPSSSGRIIANDLEVLVSRLEAAVGRCAEAPIWFNMLQAEPSWARNLRHRMESEEKPPDELSPAVVTPSIGDRLKSQMKVPEAPMMQNSDMKNSEVAEILREVVAESLPMLSRKVIEDVRTEIRVLLEDSRDAGFSKGGAVIGSPLGVLPDPVTSLPPKLAASAISEALLPQLQKPLATEIVEELIARHASQGADLDCNMGGQPLAKRSPTFDDTPSVELYEFVAETTRCDDQVIIHSASSSHPSSSQGSRSIRSVDSLEQARQGHPLVRFKTGTGFFSSTSGGTGIMTVMALETLPRRAFVVNFQRFIFMLKAFAILHDFLSSTVIASFTLVRVASFFQLWVSIGFMVANMLVYSCHSWHFDTMEISDYRNLCDLLGDDDMGCDERIVENPNRLIKALSYSQRGYRKRLIAFATWTSMVVCTGLWVLFACRYVGVFELDITQDDLELCLTLLLVGSVVVILHVVYEWLFWRETQCCMPNSPTGKHMPWDPRVHGLPMGLSWFGLPSMWFTSQEASQDLREWMSLAKGFNQEAVHSIYPQEMALFGLDQESSSQLRTVLRHAKLFDAARGTFMTGPRGNRVPLPDGAEPLELGIDLVFYDSMQFARHHDVAGEYLQPEEHYRAPVMKRLPSKTSQRTQSFIASSTDSKDKRRRGGSLLSEDEA